MKVFVPKERMEGETRVAVTPETAKRLAKEGFEITVESGAGEQSFFMDDQYQDIGATIGTDLTSLWSEADMVLKVSPLSSNPGLGKNEWEAMKEGSLAVALLAPHQNLPMVKGLVDGKVSSIAMELIPRITRAQSMDVLSSQANIAGYKAVLVAAATLPRYFPLLMTAAGTIKPAKVVIMGAGVAGLQAVATAKRLGAIVEVSDIRPAVQEEVESLGGKFIELPDMGESGEGAGGYARQVSEEFLEKQREIVARHVAAADVVITTAMVPGKRAPKLISKDMVESMKPGSVIVDLAVDAGGNCELSEKDKDVVHKNVKILGPGNLAATLSTDSSTLYARNIQTLLLSMMKEGQFQIDLEDEVVAGSLLTHEGKVIHGPTAELVEG